MGKCKDLQKKKSKHRGQNPCVQNRGPPCLRRQRKQQRNFGKKKNRKRMLHANFKVTSTISQETKITKTSFEQRKSKLERPAALAEPESVAATPRRKRAAAIADERNHPLYHYGSVHTPVPMPKAMKIPAAATDAAHLQKYQRQVVVRRDHVKDDKGCKAMLTELGASVFQMIAAHILDTISLLPGMARAANDAVPA